MAPLSNNKASVAKVLAAKMANSTPNGVPMQPEAADTTLQGFSKQIAEDKSYKNPTGPGRFQQRAMNAALDKAGKGAGVGFIPKKSR